MLFFIEYEDGWILDDSRTSLFDGGGDCNDLQWRLYFSFSVFYFRNLALEELHPTWGWELFQRVLTLLLCLESSILFLLYS